MTKKHFEWAAAYIRELRRLNPNNPNITALTIAEVQTAFATMFLKFSERFDVARFHEACERKGGK